MRRSAEGLVRRTSRVATALAVLATLQTAVAHDARPLAVVIEETAPRVYALRVRVPPTVERDNQPAVQLPVGCTANNSDKDPPLVHAGSATLIRCDSSLESARLPVTWPAYNPSLTSVLQFTPLGGPLRIAVFPPDRDALQVPTLPDARAVAWAYLQDGIHHIWSGIDHLLFVAGLLLIARTPRRILLGISGFTLAHSATLSLAALGIVSPAVEPTEAAIALSIVFLARELLREHKDTLAWRHPAVVATCFGLLHGLGFAAALQEGGLPPEHVAPALLSFNVGVEIGQLAFILAALGLLHVARRWRPVRLPGWATATNLGGHAIGIPSMFWLLQRLQTLVP